MFTEQQIQSLAPKESAFKAGKKLSTSPNWIGLSKSERAIWGGIKGSGKNPYLVQIDLANIAYKCSCPSRQFPCKHALGILLRYCSSQNQFDTINEPEHVSDWIDKRQVRAQKVDKEETEISEEEKQKRSDSKQKRTEDRLKLTNAGIAELKLWLQDLVQIGFLELPNRHPTYFDAMIAKMVDAKAAGVSGWIRALKTLDYSHQSIWQDQAMEIVGKLFLLIKASENLENYSNLEQNGIKSLLGWTFNQKDLITDKKTYTLKDHWLVLGSTKEVQDDLTVNRYWLFGVESKQDAIIIQFESQYSTNSMQPSILEGTVIEAELAFYPSSNPHRAFIKKQKEVHQSLQTNPRTCSSWQEYEDVKLGNLKANPWLNNRANLVDKVKILRYNETIIAMDQNNNYKVIADTLDGDKMSTLFLLSNRDYITLAFVDKSESIMPLGILQESKYLTI